MLTIRAGATALAFVLATSFAMAQTPTPPAKPAPAGAMKQDQTKSDSMKAEWQKDKAKWNSCDTQSKAKHLTGKASWSFFYDCMKA